MNILGLISLIELIIILALLFTIFQFRKREAKEKERIDFQKLVFENVPDIVFIKDEDCKIIDANEKFMSLYLADMQDKIIGFTTVETYKKEEAEEFLAEDRKAFQTGYTKKQETITFPDGRVRTLSTQKVRFYDENKTPYILGIATDITEQVELQIETERSQFIFRMIMDYFPGQIFVKDRDSKILYANRKFIDMYPINKQDKIIGYTTFEDYPEDIRDGLREHDLKALQLGDVTENKRLTYPNGESHDVTIRKTCFADSNGKDYILCLITKDDINNT